VTASPSSPSRRHAIKPAPNGAAAGSSSRDALGVVRNLPAGAARAALDPVLALPQAWFDLQQYPQHRWIGLEGELALPHAAGGVRQLGARAHRS
jgi:hypothetical protein